MTKKYVNVNNIEDLILAKVEIDNYLIETGVIEEKTELSSFMNKYSLLNDAFMKNGHMMPYKITKLDDKIYVFIADNTYLDEFDKIMESVNFDVSKFKKVTSSELVNKLGNVDTGEYFIIKGQTYINEI